MPRWSFITTMMLYDGSLYTKMRPLRSNMSPREGYWMSLRKALESAFFL